MKITKKAKLEQFDSVTAERDLLSLYLYDTQRNKNWDFHHKQTIDGTKDSVTANAYRLTSAMGGYVIICWRPGETVNIHSIDDFLKMAHELPFTEVTVAIKGLADKLDAAREKAFRAEAA